MYLCGVGPTEGIQSYDTPPLRSAHALFIRGAVLDAHARCGGNQQDPNPLLATIIANDACRPFSHTDPQKPLGAHWLSVAELSIRLRGGAPNQRGPGWDRERHDAQWDYVQGDGWNSQSFSGADGASWMQAILVSDPSAHRVATVLSNCFFYSHETFLAATSTLAFLIGNAARDPADLAWRRVRRSNTALWERLGEDGFRVLQACGYRQEFNGNEVRSRPLRLARVQCKV